MFATYYAYNNADQVTSTTSPGLGTGEPHQVTLTFHDTLGRVTGTQLPDGSTTTNFYYQSGLVQKTSGSRIYPVEYTYDAQGRMRTMKTWQDFAGNSGAATTRWNYDPYRGWLKSKDYPDAASGQPPAQEGTGGPVYTYTAAGRLATRVWKRGVTTTYGYNNAGDLQAIDYSDTTPDVSYTYDRRGRRKTGFCNGITTTWTYNDVSQPLTESYSGGTLAGLAMNWAYDTSLRLQTVTAKNGATALQSAAYSYDAAGRLQTVTDSPYTATYTYHPNSTLINTVTFANNGVTRLVTTRVYDKLNRLTSISSVASGPSAPSLPVSFGYQYNAANQRTRMNLADGSYWVYQYDALGQVLSGKRYWSDGTPVAGQQFEYRFDDIGNRKSTAVGGDADGANLRGATYTANRLNQYSSRTVPAYVDILGIANLTAAVTVNGNTAQYRRGEYFHHALNIPNSTAQYPTVTVVSQYGGGQTETGKVFVPPASESFAHDADGNLTSDGRWTYSWDAENRLAQMIRDTDNPSGARQKLVFEYDHQGRRIRKQFFTYNGGWQEQTDTMFLYDGWNLVAELNANASNARLRTCVWGTDLSGTMQGAGLPAPQPSRQAGGVGGLLKLTCYGGTTTNAFPAYDGNGNVAALIDAANGNAGARYEYGPFAEPIRSSGPLSKLNPIRFSTKYTDNESGFLYYGYRYYNPSTGRWLSRDPVDQSNQPLYSLVSNDPMAAWDYLGLLGASFVTTSPKWHPAKDWFWAAVSFAFNRQDRGALGPVVTLVVQHFSQVQVTPCTTSRPMKETSSTRWFARELGLGPFGRVEDRRSGYEASGEWGFELGWLGYYSYEAYRQMGDKTDVPTSGSYTTSVEVRVYAGHIDFPAESTGLPTDWLHPESSRSHQGWIMFSDSPVKGHAVPCFETSISLSFGWDNCCGRMNWNFSYCPIGVGRDGRHIGRESTSPGTIYLLDKPNNP